VPETVANAVAQRDASPGALIKQYSTSFASVLPTHIRPDTWVRLAQGALKKGRRLDNNPANPFELEVAAANNPGAFLAALLDAARLGLEPGTESYYLTPRKVKGKLEILGIVGYQGYIDLMFRSGAVGSVTVQVVRENDRYRFDRGLDTTPVHQFPNFAREAERGKLVGVYSYAQLLTGATSQVVELNADDIERIKAVNPFSDGANSPWVKWEKDMWMKSAARQLRKWVPTSPEFRREIARATAEVQRVIAEPDKPAGIDAPQGDAIEGDWEEASPADEWPAVAEVPGGAPDA
jgi:recombination protein RecT